jgi:hypothetical protein
VLVLYIICFPENVDVNQQAKWRYPENERGQIKEVVNWHGALKKQGEKQGGVKQGIRCIWYRLN